jgi:transposase
MSAKWQSHEELVFEVVTLCRQKVPRRAIARALGVSRNTVRKILEVHEEHRDDGRAALVPQRPRLARVSKIDPFKPRVAELLAKYPDITAQRVLETLTEEGFSGAYTCVKKCLRKMRPKPKPKPSLETPDWGPGKMSESDWTPYDIVYTTGQHQRIQVFSYVLVHSTRKFYQAYESYDVHALMAGHDEAFQRFGGCAECCKYDGQAAVAQWEGNQPIYNPRFLAFCAHYEMRPWALRGNPNLRPRVERSFWECERSFLNGREFRDLEDFRRQLAHWLDTIVDHRKRHGVTALERFADELPHLLPLPRHPYDTARVVYRICSIDGFVDWQGNRYAVPYDHVTDILPIRITQRELFIYAPDIRCIARHELAPRGAGLPLDPEGFHRQNAKQAAVDREQLREVYEGMGSGAAEFFRCLSASPSKQWTRQARRILTLRQRFATDVMDRALERACRFGALHFESVQRILEACHPPRSLDEYVAAETRERMHHALDGHRIEPRDLAEYDRIPGATAALSTIHTDVPPDSAKEMTDDLEK